MEEKKQIEKIGAETLKEFFLQFGKMDTYSQIVLEEFFKELLNEEQSIYISGEVGQKRDENIE